QQESDCPGIDLPGQARFSQHRQRKAHGYVSGTSVVKDVALSKVRVPRVSIPWAAGFSQELFVPIAVKLTVEFRLFDVPEFPPDQVSVSEILPGIVGFL